jgi:putative hydrolase of the HAD superfamily
VSGVHGVLLDGDDTLWKWQEIYDDAKQRFVALMQRSGIGSDGLLPRLDVLDAQRVPLRGFILERFLETMVILYAQLSAEKRMAWEIGLEKEIRDLGLLFKRPLRVYDDTRVVLQQLSGKTNLYLYSAGHRSTQEAKVRQLGLDAYFAKLFIVPTKDEEQLRRAVASLDLPPKRAWMVGNSLRSDIAPATKVGLHAILVDRGQWAYDRHMLPTDMRRSYKRVDSLSQAAAIILRAIV